MKKVLYSFIILLTSLTFSYAEYGAGVPVVQSKVDSITAQTSILSSTVAKTCSDMINIHKSTTGMVVQGGNVNASSITGSTLTITGDNFTMKTSSGIVQVDSPSSGFGEIRIGTDTTTGKWYIYISTAANVWGRTELTTW